MTYTTDDFPGSTVEFLEDTKAPGILLADAFRPSFLIVGGDPATAIMLDDQYGGQSFPVDDEQGFCGLFVSKVRLVIDKSSAFRPGRFRRPMLSLLDYDGTLVIVGWGWWDKRNFFRRGQLIPWAGKSVPRGRPTIGYSAWQIWARGVDREVMLYSRSNQVTGT